MSQPAFDFGAGPPPRSGQGAVFFCFKPPQPVTAELLATASELKLQSVIDEIRPAETLHVSLVSVGEYQDLHAVAASAARIADGVRGTRFIFEFTDLMPFGGPTAVLTARETPQAATDLQRALALGLRRPGFRPKVGLNAHITIAYTKANVAPRPLDQPILWPVKEFFLVISRPRVGHEILGRWSLT